MSEPLQKIFTETITITFGDQAENHVGMVKLGKKATEGFTIDDLQQARRLFEDRGAQCEWVDLKSALTGTEFFGDAEEAVVLIVRNGVSHMLSDGKTADNAFKEQATLKWDTQYFNASAKKVENKRARFNLCYDDVAQQSDFKAGKGTIIAFEALPCLRDLRASIGAMMGIDLSVKLWFFKCSLVTGSKGMNLVAEGNRYYDLKNCGIGFHGDAERMKVVACRLGASMNLHYQWFLRGFAVGERIQLMLHHGDVYIMSQKSTGNDCSTSVLALKHACGSQKYTTIHPTKYLAQKKSEITVALETKRLRESEDIDKMENEKIKDEPKKAKTENE